MKHFRLIRRPWLKLLSRCSLHDRRSSHTRLYVTSCLDHARKYQPGQTLNGYTVKQVEEVPELSLVSVLLTHDKTGAQHLHVSRDDSNNTFSVAFRTTPRDDTGVSHILEHTVLCGSQRYPVRDPFFKMLNRSMATFMNAMTASDWTIYPFSTQNAQDFRNLLSIYLDAVFYPQLRELDFRQEGWRLEHTDPNDTDSPVIFKGVVFNEMKGVFSDSQNIYVEAAQRKLMPSHTYGVASGGDPEHIPSLTYEGLKAFHQTHYHPSNSRFFTYGNLRLEDNLQFLNDAYLSRFNKLSVNTKVPKEPRWKSPREVSIQCQPDPMAPDPSKQTTVTINFLLSDISDSFETFVLGILSMLLIDGETSPFYQALLEANIGSDYAPVSGYSAETFEASFSVGLQGIHSDDIPRVKQIIGDTFDQVIKEGFEQDKIEAILHKIELSIKHQTSNFGLGLILSVTSNWNHDGDPIQFLKIQNHVNQFRAALESTPRFLQDKVAQYFKSNPHCLTLTMSPDESYQEKLLEKEQVQLKSVTESLTEQDKTKLHEQGLKLLEKQMMEEDLSCLPTLKIADIDKHIIKETVSSVSVDDTCISYSEQPTNGVTYLRVMSNMAALPAELKQYVPLFCSIVTKMGAGDHDYKVLSHLTELYTGGLIADVEVCPDYSNMLNYEEGVMFSSFCLDKNLNTMLDLWLEIFNRPNFNDTARLTTLVRMTAADLATSLVGSGHSYAMTHSASTLTPAARLIEMCDGITQVGIMKRIAEMDDLQAVITNLQGIGQHLLKKSNMRLMLNATPDAMPKALDSVKTFVNGIPGSHHTNEVLTKEHDFHASESYSQIEMPFSVNYVSKSIQTVPYEHPDFARLRVLSRLLTSKFLHREIREKGGAYGGGAVCRSGFFSYYSYRDPNSLGTLDVFEQTGRWVEKAGFSEQDVNEAKLSVFQQIDKPVPPGQRGVIQFSQNITDEMRQVQRDQIFAVDKLNIIDVSSRYLSPGSQTSAVSFLGPENGAVKEDKRWKIIVEDS